MNCATFYPVVEPDHQLNQFVLAQALQISAIHAHMDSEIELPGKGHAEITRLTPICAPKKWRWVITVHPPSSSPESGKKLRSVESVIDFGRVVLRAHLVCVKASSNFEICIRVRIRWCENRVITETHKKPLHQKGLLLFFILFSSGAPASEIPRGREWSRYP